MPNQARDDLFDQALSIPAAQRTAFLEQACAGDNELLAEIEELLSDYERAHEFFEGLGEKMLNAAVEDDLGDVPPPPCFSHYQGLEKVGSGGMGVVYKARDGSLNRIVAVKVLRNHLSRDRHARARFLQEARAASAIDHPNVCTVHEVGEIADGHVFIAMAWYEGQTLQNLLTGGNLPFERVISWGTQIAQGLEAAHSRGIVHRDIKPANLLVTNGSPGTNEGLLKILDFGLAKIAGVELTRSLGPLGTLAYMSPEQTRGQTVDHRTDIWSTGIVLYEMLTGVRPFRGESEQVVVHAIRHDSPDPVRKLRPDTPVLLAEIVDRCLQKDAARRYSDAGALRAALSSLTNAHTTPVAARRTLAAALGIPLLLGLAALNVGPDYRDVGAGPVRGVTSSAMSGGIAVLPLTYRGGDEEAFLADSLGDEIISHVSRLRGLRVIGRRSIRQYRSTNKPPDQIGRELNVHDLVQGDISTGVSGIRLRLRLINASTGTERWSKQYDSASGGFSRLSQNIAADLAAILRVKEQDRQSGHLQRRYVVGEQAYTSYLKAQYFLSKRDKQSLWDARDHFQKAIDIEPTFSEAWAGLANSYLLLSSYSWIPAGEAGARARSAAQHALKLNPGLPEAHTALATVLQQYDWDRQRAGEHFRRAIELNPGHATARQWYSEHLWSLRRFDEAIAEARTARALDPLALPAQLSVGIALYMAGRFDEAVADYQQLLAVDPRNTLTSFYLGLAYAHQKQYEKAIAHFRKVETRWGYGPDATAALGSVYADIGMRTEARRMLRLLEQLSGRQQVTPFHPAVILYRLGEKDRAFELLNRGADMRVWYVQLLNADHGFNEMRSDPRFQSLLKRTGF